MEKKELEKYLIKRYYPQIEWYDKKASWNKRVYQWLQWLLIVFSAFTPVLILLEEEWSKCPAIVIAILVAIGTGSLKVFKYQENWISYRTTCESLRKEIYFYNAKINNYKNVENPEALFVERVESLISRENTFWLTIKSQKEEVYK